MQVWNYVKKTDRDESAVPRACCDTVHRGVNYAKGKVIYHTLDGFVIALDATTGKEVWVVKHAYPEKGETITGPTLIAENLVIAGFGGDEFAARGRLTAYDIETGKVVWNCHSTGPDKDVCMTPDTNKANPHFGTAGTGHRHHHLSRRPTAASGRSAAAPTGPGAAMTPSSRSSSGRPATPATGARAIAAATRPTTSATPASGTTSGR